MEKVDSKTFLLFGLENYHKVTLKWTYPPNYAGLKILNSIYIP